ncbi:hypothetical protein D9758_007864 [Tetrapyrgos nigripes]|uniref:Uncharacterized protein n=1 Tax=Tetrapyrgos nigripes TaxID=182062 RepID=A0A8H5FUH0_9AGAR|nr:hypothetical protein D9758_007864 [Tetrapyrgos nigripes]
MSNSTSDSTSNVDHLSAQDASFMQNWIIQEAVEGLFYGIEFFLTLSAIYFLV